MFMESILKEFRKCSVEGCIKPVRKVGMCSSCYSLKQYYKRRVLRSCAECGVQLDNNRKVYCPNCRRARDLDRDRKDKAIRRAAGVRRTTVPMYDNLLKRSGGKCGICRMEMSAEFKYPHPLSIAIDHICPIALGGAHKIDNLQMAHSWCNLMKKDSSTNHFKSKRAQISYDLVTKLLEGCGAFALPFSWETLVAVDYDLFEDMKQAYLDQNGMV